MDPIQNPYAPGAGQRPPALTGRDEELRAFDVVLARVAKGRPERSIVLTGLRGVGKTVLLNTLRSSAVRTGWGTGKLEARPGQSLRRPLGAALHMAIRELGHPSQTEMVLGTVRSFVEADARPGTKLRDRWNPGITAAPTRGRADSGDVEIDLVEVFNDVGGLAADLGHPSQTETVLGTVRSFVEADARPGTKLRDRWNPGITAAPTRGRADSGDVEIDLVEVFNDVGGLAADLGTGVAVFIDEMQDLGPEDVSAICAACHELSQQGLPLIVVGAGLPHLPAVLSASKSYSERLFRYVRIDRLAREAADAALVGPAAEEDAEYEEEALAALYEATGGYPYFIQAYGKAVWDAAPTSPVTVEDVRVAVPQAEAELAVGFFGSRFERATPAEREYLRAMAEVGGEEPVGTAEVAEHLDRKPQSLSPARDSLMKKGLVYSGERGKVQFTVPHFGRYLSSVPGTE